MQFWLHEVIAPESIVRNVAYLLLVVSIGMSSMLLLRLFALAAGVVAVLLASVISYDPIALFWMASQVATSSRSRRYASSVLRDRPSSNQSASQNASIRAASSGLRPVRCGPVPAPADRRSAPAPRARVAIVWLISDSRRCDEQIRRCHWRQQPGDGE